MNNADLFDHEMMMGARGDRQEDEGEGVEDEEEGKDPQ